MDTRYADLHIHTSASDGAYAPARVVALAVERGFSAISITDHDAVSGIGEALEEGERLGIEVIPGVELSTEYQEKEIHILGFYIDWKDPRLNELISEFRDFRVKRMERMLAVLRDLGCHVDEEALMKNSEEGAVGRVHLAKAMLESGFVSTIDEAFDRYLAAGRPAYMKKAELSPKQACDLIKSTGGIAILAHPHLNRKDSWITRFIADGIDGIETWYSNMKPEETERYTRIAAQNGLLITGGSDCHQSETKFLLGSVKFPYEYVEKLKNLAAKRRQQKAADT